MGKGEREGGRERGGEGRMEERYTALQQGSKILQSAPAQQIEPITERGIFSFRGLPPQPHPFLHTSSVISARIRRPGCKKKKEKEVPAGNLASEVLLGFTFRDGGEA